MCVLATRWVYSQEQFQDESSALKYLKKAIDQKVIKKTRYWNEGFQEKIEAHLSIKPIEIEYAERCYTREGYYEDIETISFHLVDDVKITSTSFGSFTGRKNKNYSHNKFLTFYLMFASSPSIISIPVSDTNSFDLPQLYKAISILAKKKQTETIPLNEKIKEANKFKHYAYLRLPKISLNNFQGVPVLLDSANNKIGNASHPTLLITWYYFYKKVFEIGIQFYDDLFRLNVTDFCNIVMMKKNYKTDSIESVIDFINTEKPQWRHASLLHETDEKLKQIDNDDAPFFIWLDRMGNIIWTHGGLINMPDNLELIQKISSGKIHAGKIKYFNSMYFPTDDISNAKVKHEIIEQDNYVRLNVYYKKNENFELKKSFKYLKDADGMLKVDISSL